MRKLQKVPEQLSLRDLVSKILEGGINNDHESIYGRQLVAFNVFVQPKLSPIEYSVLDSRYCINNGYEETSVAYVAGVLNISEAEVRRLEAEAIKRLREPDCFSWFVKNFGSKEALIEQIKQAQASIQRILEQGNIADSSFSVQNLSLIVGSMDTFVDTCRRYANKRP